MANKFYPKGAEKVLSGAIKFDADTIAVGLVSNAYTFSVDHEFLSSLGTLVGTPQVLAGKTVTGGVFNADDPVFGAIAPGSTIKALANDTDKPEISAAHHHKLVHWALHRAFSRPDSDAFDPNRAAKAEAQFSAYFGSSPDSDLRRSTRIDETQTNKVFWP